MDLIPAHSSRWALPPFHNRRNEGLETGLWRRVCRLVSSRSLGNCLGAGAGPFGDH
jgi:hypothetical protein